MSLEWMNEWTCELRREKEFGATAKLLPAARPGAAPQLLLVPRAPGQLPRGSAAPRSAAARSLLQSRAGPAAGRLLRNAFDPSAPLPGQRGPSSAGRRGAVRALLRLRWEQQLERGRDAGNALPPSASTACSSVPFVPQLCPLPKVRPAYITPFSSLRLFGGHPLTQEPAERQQGSSTGTAFQNHCREVVSHLNLHTQV